MNVVIDKYELIEKLGEGAFGVVFKAKNLLFDKIIALKIIKGVSEDQLQLFLREIRKMDKLTPSHPNVMRIISADIKDNALLIEMDYLEGGTLQKLIQDRKRLDDETIYNYTVQILEALSFIHSKRLVHRDLKPDNILLNKNGSALKISDFGISKDLDNRSYSRSIQGTLLYMSPEQLTDPLNVDHRSDFYSLAILIYQLKTGEIPFSDSITNIIDAKRSRPLPKTNSFLDPIIQKASKKKPNDRYPSADDFKKDFIKAYDKRKKKSNTSIFWIVLLIAIAGSGYFFRDEIFTFVSFDKGNAKVDNTMIPEFSNVNTIDINGQIWMNENLGTKEFRNGTPILEALNKEQWDKACLNKIPAYCHVDNDPVNDSKYGLLYNWYAVRDSICPEGFEIPTKQDLDKLISTNDFSSLSDKFNILYSGWRGDDGYYRDFNKGMFLWTKEEKVNLKGCIYTLKVFKSDDKGIVKIGEQKPSDGYSIRCIKKM